MADYNSMKVPELKKLLTERGLPHTGNKADLIARLTENDKQKAADSAAPQAGKPPPLPRLVASLPGAITCAPLRRRPIASVVYPSFRARHSLLTSRLLCELTRLALGAAQCTSPQGTLPRANPQLNPSTDAPATTRREAARRRGRDRLRG